MLSQSITNSAPPRMGKPTKIYKSTENIQIQPCIKNKICISPINQRNKMKSSILEIVILTSKEHLTSSTVGHII